MNNTILKRLVILVIGVCLISCQSDWSILIEADTNRFFINRSTINAYRKFINEQSVCTGLPLEIAFYQNGINVVENVKFSSSNGENHSFCWKDIADKACVNQDGSISINENHYFTDKLIIELDESNFLRYSLLDIYSTVATALGIEFNEKEFNYALTEQESSHVLFLYLDGLSFSSFQKAIDQGWFPSYKKSIYHEPALTVYPPRTTIATAATITGKHPNQNGVFKSGIRETELETICDAIADHGLSGIAVEGESISFQLGRCELYLSGDRDQGGSTDDNIFQNTISIIKAELPNFLFVHFHGIDDTGHTFGPDSPEMMSKIHEISKYIEEIIKLVPENSLVITSSDHGMHAVQGNPDKGNHGNLIEEDMVVFINILIV